MFPGIPTTGQSSSTVGGADLWNQPEDDVWLPKADRKRHPGFASFALGLLILAEAKPCCADPRAAHVSTQGELGPSASSHGGGGLFKQVLQRQDVEAHSN